MNQNKFSMDFSLIDYPSLIVEIGGNLDQFKMVSSKKDTYNFRCNICGDSAVSKIKKRGYIYRDKKNGGYYYKCFNCGDSRIPLITYTKEYFPDLYRRYVYNNLIQQKNDHYYLEELEESYSGDQNISYTLPDNWLKLLTPWIESPIARRYLDYRMIPKHKRTDIYFIEDLNILLNKVNELLSIGYSPLRYRSPRIVIPVYSRDRSQINGFVCRSVLKKDFRFYNIKLIETESLLLGTDKINVNKPIYIVEGYFDSLFLTNAIATNSATTFHEGYSFCKEVNQEPIFLLDNEPYNKDILKLYDYWIKMNEKIVIFSSFPYKEKDLNKMVMSNNELFNGEVNIEDIIQKKIYKGIQAKLEFNRWKADIVF